MKIIAIIVVVVLIIVLAFFLFAKYLPQIEARAERNFKKNFDTAVRRGDMAAVEKMLKKGPYVSLNGALNYAAEQGNIEMVKFFIEKGAEINKVHGGYTPLARAIMCTALMKEAKYTELVKFLIDQGADVNLKDENGMTPLQLAEKYGTDLPQEIKEMLKRAGAK